jgi:multidrug efflux system membrane fusion protein
MLPTALFRNKKRIKFWCYFTVIFIVLVAGYFYLHRSRTMGPDMMAEGGMPPRGGSHGGGMPRRGFPMAGGVIPVQAGLAEREDVPVYLNALGTVVANATVTVTSQVSGQLMKVYFTEGQKVEAGQVLAQIDPRSYQATLDQYQGALRQNQAQLKSAQLTLDRYQKLYSQNSLARQDLDSQAATVGQYAGAVQSDQAQIDAAKLNLQYARITAPVSGRVGLRLVDPGNVISSSSTTGIVTITQTQPIAVTFSVPQSHLPVLLEALHQGKFLPTTAFDQDNKQVMGEGKLQFISNSIDSTTGTVKLKALFANERETLYPNQFVNVRLQTTTLANATVVPSAALQLSADGDFVYIIKDDSTVVRQPVKSGPPLGSDKLVILSGVNPGDRLVTVGIDRLTNGSKVQVVTANSANAQTPDAEKEHKKDTPQSPEHQSGKKAWIHAETTGKDSGSK